MRFVGIPRFRKDFLGSRYVDLAKRGLVFASDLPWLISRRGAGQQGHGGGAVGSPQERVLASGTPSSRPWPGNDSDEPPDSLED
jgi:hypothetical protein